MIILFKGKSFGDGMIGWMEYVLDVKNGTDEVDIDTIKKSIQSIKEYINDAYYNEDSENADKADEVELWDAYDCFEKALDKIGYTYELLNDELVSDTFTPLILVEHETPEFSIEAEIEY